MVGSEYFPGALADDDMSTTAKLMDEVALARPSL
jgi:hypothetical protein